LLVACEDIFQKRLVFILGFLNCYSSLSTYLPTSTRHARGDGEEYRPWVRFWARFFAYELCLAQTAAGRSSGSQMQLPCHMGQS